MLSQHRRIAEGGLYGESINGENNWLPLLGDRRGDLGRDNDDPGAV